MKKVYVLFLLTFGSFLTNVNAQIAAWDFNGLVGNEVTVSATTLNTNLAATTVSRGPGLLVSTLGSAFSSTDFSLNGTFTDAVTNGDYLQFTITANATYKFSLSTLDVNFRRSSTGPNTFQWQYSLDGFSTAGVNIGAAISFTNTTTNGVAQTQINLSAIPALQDVINPSIVTFRLYGYGATATTGTFALGRLPGNDLAIGGTVTPVSGNSITTGVVAAPPFCVDATNTASGTVAFTTTGTYTGETLTAKLSDAAGSFATPINVGTTTISGTDPSGTINITIPAGTPTGTGYKIRIDEATIPITGSESTAFTIVNGVLDVTTPAASVANSSSVLTWTNPAGCYDEVLIVARATSANDGVPTGDGTAYTASPVFGTGTALGSGFVVYKGTGTTETVTALVNGTTYYYKFFTRLGTTWSAGVEVNATPAVVTLATDYFRSVASGDWATLATWESSSDSTSWMAATLAPGALAAHVTVQSPDSVWLSALTTTINLTVNSGAVINAQANTLVLTNRLNLLGTASFYQAGTSSIVPGVVRVLDPTSNYHFNGTQAGTSTGAYPEFGNFYWEPNASGSGTFQNSAAVAPFNLGLVVRGDMTINLQNAAPTEIRFASGSSITRSHTIDGDLNIISAGSRVVINNGGLPVQSTITVGGDINISAGILQGTSTFPATDGNAILNLRGHIFNTGGTIQTGLSTAGLFSINYVGTVGQTINNSGGTFNFTANQRDTLNNSDVLGLTLNTPISHYGNIHFDDGFLFTSAVNLLTMEAGSSVSGPVSDESFVMGPMKKIGNTAFIFPVGKPNGIIPIGISGFSGGTVTDAFTAEYIRSSAAALGPVTDPLLTRVSYCEYWTLVLNSGTPTVDLTLYWRPNNTCGNGPYITNLPTLEIARFDGTNWSSSSFGFSSKNGNEFNGDITWPGVSTFGPFSLASSSAANPLPITINYFNGSKQNGNHLLNWKVTCISTPSATIELERSTDGRTYNSIYSIFATAVECQQPFNYTDASPAKGVNYYRLKMTDVDGKVTYSSIVTLINAVKGMEVMDIAPNPIVNGGFNLKISTAEKTQLELVVIDMQGRLMMKQSANAIAGFNIIPVNVRQLAAGTYQLFGNTPHGRTRVLRFVVQ